MTNSSFFLFFLKNIKAMAATSFVWFVGMTILVFFVIPVWYKSEVRFLPPESSSNGFPLAGIAGISLPSSNSGLKAEYVQEVFESGEFRFRLIEQFDLIRRFKSDKTPFPREHAIQQLKGRVTLLSTQSSSIGLSDMIAFSIKVEDRNPDSAYLICRQAIHNLDSVMVELANAQAARKVQFLRSRLDSSEILLRELYADYALFQKKTKSYDLPNQLGVSAEVAGEISKSILSDESALNLIRKTEGGNSQAAQLLSARISESKRRMNSLLIDTAASMVPSLNRGTGLAPIYEKKIREIRAQTEIIKVLRQQYEMENLDAMRRYSLLRIVDHPKVSLKKSRPKRLVLLGALAAAGTIVIIIGFWVFSLMPAFWAEINKLRKQSNCA